MKIIRTDNVTPEDIPTQQERDWCYNGLDCCITSEIFDTIYPQLDDLTAATYAFSRALQGPALEMRLRGVLVDQSRKAEVIDGLYDQLDKYETQLERIVFDGVGLDEFNWRSPKDLQHLFYDVLQIPPIRKHGRPTTDRDAREKLEVYLVAKPICVHLNALADIAKKISVLKTGIDPDGRLRTSYNIAGTSTGRFSSSASEFGTGGNLQNIEESIRSIFVADTGFKFAKFDAKSGESYCVGAIEWNLFRDGRYLDAVESGDVHVAVAGICWPGHGWTGDRTQDRDLSERPFYRHHSYRDMCKKLGHGSNYGGQAKTLAQQAKLPESVVREFQSKYFQAFPAHLRWHEWVDDQLRRVGNLVSLTGRRRWFFGRRNDPATFREAVAYDPQGSLADIVNRAMLRIWRAEIAILMMQDHDALTFMYPETSEAEVVPRLQSLLIEHLPLRHGRVLAIPYDCQVGWNKGKYHAETNADGLRDWKGRDERTRTPQVSLLDRIIHRKYFGT